MWNAAKESVSDLGKAIVDTSALETVRSIKGVGGVTVDATKYTLQFPNMLGSSLWSGATTIGGGVLEGAKGIAEGGLNIFRKAGKKIAGLAKEAG